MPLLFILLFVVATQTTTFTFAALFGQFINRRFRRIPLSESAPLLVTATLVRLAKTHTKYASEKLEFLKVVAALMTPVMAFLGTVVSSWLTFLGNHAK